MRAHLYALARIYGLLVDPVSVTNNLVKTVVKGNKKEIERFYAAVSDYCKTELKLGVSRVKNLQKYKGAEREWQAMASFYTVEQLTKGIDYLQSIDNQFRDARNRFDNIGRGVNVVNEQVKILPDLVREMKGLREDTTEEMREMRKVISKFTSVVKKLVKEQESLSAYQEQAEKRNLGGQSLKVSYDPDSDVLYMHFKDGSAKSVKEVEDDVVVELDRDGEVMGIEVWGIRKKGVLKQLTQIAVSH